jgi:purine nucleosidase
MIHSVSKLLFFLLYTFSVQATYAQQPVRIILDTDMDSDVDDAGALAMLHTLLNHNVIDLLGIIVTSDDPYAPSCTDAINHYYGRPDIPIGAQKGNTMLEQSRYTKQIAAEFPHRLKTYNDAEDATVLYRKLLAAQPDSSVVLVTIGHLTNLQKLLESGPCQNSKLNGIELVAKKVKLWSCMGGNYPEGKEANFYRPDPQSTVVGLAKYPGKAVFSGWDLGNKILTGGQYLKKSIPEDSPLWRAYELYNDFAGRPSWDQTSILYAVADPDAYWELDRHGKNTVANDGSNKWEPGNAGNHGYLKEKMDPVEVAKIIDALMAGVFSIEFLKK